MNVSAETRTIRTKAIVIVPDAARVIRVSELRTLYELAGDLRTLSEALDGVSPATLSRWLGLNRGANRQRANRDEAIAAVREILTRGGDTRCTSHLGLTNTTPPAFRDVLLSMARSAATVTTTP